MRVDRLLNFIEPGEEGEESDKREPRAHSECSELCGHKDEKLGHKGADGAVAIEVHLDGQEQVPGLRDGLGEGHHPAVGVHLPGGEKALVIAAGDGQLHAVPGDGAGGAHAEDHGGHLDVGGEREVVVGYSQRQPVALLILMARQALAAAARQVTETGGLGPVQQAGGGAGSGCGGLPPLGPQTGRSAPHSPAGGAVGLRAADSGTSLFQHPRGAWGSGVKGCARRAGWPLLTGRAPAPVVRATRAPGGLQRGPREGSSSH